MAEASDRPASGGRLALCVDAFLYTGALFLLTQGLAGIATILVARFGSTGAVEFAGLLLMAVSLLAGALLAWRLHGHELRGKSWLGMVAGVVIGGPLMIAAFFALFAVGRFIPNPIPSVEGPWGVVLVLLVAVVVFLAVPIVDAFRDLSARRRTHVRLDWMRLVAFAIIAVAVVATTAYGIRTGSEVAEAGIFMVPVAAAAACAVFGADLFEAWRARKAQAAAPTSDA